MDPPGSSQWMDPVEPKLEAAMLNRYAGRAGSGGGPIRAPAPCPAGANVSIRRSPSSRWARAMCRAAAWAAVAVAKPMRCELGFEGGYFTVTEFLRGIRCVERRRVSG